MQKIIKCEWKTDEKNMNRIKQYMKVLNDDYKQEDKEEQINPLFTEREKKTSLDPSSADKLMPDTLQGQAVTETEPPDLNSKV